MPAQWIRCGSLVTGHGETPLADMAIELEADRIRQIQPWPAVAGTVGAGVLDWSGHTVTPGFIDAHVHLLFTCEVDHTVTRARVENAGPEQLALVAARNAAECLLGGVTTVRDCGDKDFVTLRMRDAVADGLLPGPRILAAGPPVTTTAGHLYWCGNAADSIDELRRATRRLCASGVDVVKLMASGGNMTLGSNGLLPQFTAAEMAVVVEEAHRLGRRVAAHAQNTESIRRAVAAGVDTVEHCGWRAPDGTEDIDMSVVDAMVRRGTWVVITYAGIARLMLPEYADQDSVERRATMALSPTKELYADFGWARVLRKAGVRMALASDAGERFTPFRRFDESVRCGMVTMDITASEAIGMATLQAADALGIADETGSIDVGKRADLLVFDGPVTDSTTRLGELRQVWRDGRVVVDQGRLVID
jgi:imidazolonepropionase-like amidohydrolase